MHRDDWRAFYLINQDRIYKWDIEIGEINHLYDLKNEIEGFQFELKDALTKESVLEFSYQNRIKKRAKMYDMDIETYLELIDIIEENNFWIYEVKKIF
ncbi:MAG: hypothetical protein DSY46_02425 [Hydrogenimonas sp.]|nr:MAG: hypothetical protein DSY46_02425 [Hydrogenimonas sp.]